MHHLQIEGNCALTH